MMTRAQNPSQIAKAVFTGIMGLEAAVLLVAALASLSFALGIGGLPGTENDPSSKHLLDSLTSGSVGTLFLLGLWAAWEPRFPLQKVLVGVSFLGLALFNIYWVVTVL